MKHDFTNREIADTMKKMAICYEMERIPFKPAAYERAAESIENLGEEVGDVWRRGDTKELEKIDGIGPAIAEHIQDLLERGSFRELTFCLRRLPDDVLALVDVPELGPHKVRTLYERLHVRTLNDLERAAKAGRISELPGFGKRSEEKILHGIELARQSDGRRLLGDVLPLARSLEMKLNSTPGVRRAVVAGSVRRRQETVGDFDLVVTSDQPRTALAAIAELADVKKILERGQRNLRMELKNGLTCDLIVVADNAYGAALQHFTGDKNHNVTLRRLAADQGLKLNEYGLWRGRKRLAADNETDIYHALGLPFIEPEMRLGTGEIEIALAGRLPTPLPYGSVRGDLQVQSDWTDGTASIENMAQAALIDGLEYIAVTDHTKSLAMVGGLDERRLARQAKEIERVNGELKRQGKKFTVLKGAEVNIRRDGSLDVADASLKKLDVVGAAVHSNFNLSKIEQTERLIRAMRNQHVDIIFHPTGRIIGRREPIALDIEKIMRAAKETGTALEIDSYPDRSDLKTAHVRLAVEYGVKLAIDSDAHRPEHFRYLELGEAIARRGWAAKPDVINTKTATKLIDWLTTAKEKRR
ncbi:MAG: DNA polymerase/3'-5' exonuclease PolX [Patescibacteria group bacterium]